jgi:predicted RNA binding protein YcfA (HicA-like mRNA interferase family)
LEAAKAESQRGYQNTATARIHASLQRGSHQQWQNDDMGKQVIVPFHKGKQLPLGTLRGTIEGWHSQRKIPLVN